MTDDRPALSLNQEFLCSLDHGERAGALSQWYPVSFADVTARTAGLIRFSRGRFEEATIAKLAARYRQVLPASVAEPTAQLVP